LHLLVDPTELLEDGQQAIDSQVHFFDQANGFMSSAA
jgi:hypothetical protein